MATPRREVLTLRLLVDSRLRGNDGEKEKRASTAARHHPAVGLGVTQEKTRRVPPARQSTIVRPDSVSSGFDLPTGTEHLARSASGPYGDVRLGGVHHDGGLEAAPGGGSDGLEAG